MFTFGQKIAGIANFRVRIIFMIPQNIRKFGRVWFRCQIRIAAIDTKFWNTFVLFDIGRISSTKKWHFRIWFTHAHASLALFYLVCSKKKMALNANEVSIQNQRTRKVPVFLHSRTQLRRSHWCYTPFIAEHIRVSSQCELDAPLMDVRWDSLQNYYFIGVGLPIVPSHSDEDLCL